MADSTPKIALQVLEIPTSLVLLEKSYQIILQIQNISPISGNFKVSYEGTGFQIKSSDLLNKEISLPPNSSEIDRIELIPKQKGLISLSVNVIHLKEVIKEIVRIIEPPPPPSPSELPSSPSSDLSSTSPSDFLTDSEPNILSDQEILSYLKPLPPPEPQKNVEKIKEIVEEELFSTAIYLNALDKQSSAVLKKFAQKGDSNILTSETGLPLCICYFYSEIQDRKWKIRPALIRNLSIRLKEKFGKFGYYISYPLSKKMDEKEISAIQEAIKTFVLPYSSGSNPMLILNLDIIPELEKPSIIIGYEKSGVYETVKNLLSNVFGNSIDIFVDDCVFSGGLFYNYLVNWIGPSQTHVLNIILSNNFVSNITLFQTLLESLISLTIGKS